MPAKVHSIEDRYQSESCYAITGAFCLGWSADSDQLAAARLDAGGATLHCMFCRPNWSTASGLTTLELARHEMASCLGRA